MALTRRFFLKNLAVSSIGLTVLPSSLVSGIMLPNDRKQKDGFKVDLKSPICIYNNWAAYDELSDNVKLTEQIAMKQLDEVIRLKKFGVQIDAYLMDMFWFDKDGGFREFRKESWPNGADRWFEKCKENNILPGLWFSTNVVSWGSPWINPANEWKDSFSADGKYLCLFHGGYLDHLMQTLQLWYNKGVRVYKFDFANFNAATPEIEATMLSQDIVENNIQAWLTALKVFKLKNPDAIFQAYNGYGGDHLSTHSSFKKNIDLRWLEVFDSLFCGDPRPSDVPMINFWRSKDLYSDHMVAQYKFNGVPLQAIDNCGFMIGNTGTCYGRKNTAWKGTYLLSLARGGYINNIYGDLTYLSDEDVKWISAVQTIFNQAQKFGKTSLWGGLPGASVPYGYYTELPKGEIFTIINPTQTTAVISLPKKLKDAKLLFKDDGFIPVIASDQITLGPEQIALIGTGDYSSINDLGTNKDIIIPQKISELKVVWTGSAKRKTSKIKVDSVGHIRVVTMQSKGDAPYRSSGGWLPWGKPVSDIIKITIINKKKNLELTKTYDRIIWSGISWGVCELEINEELLYKELEISVFTEENENVTIDGKVFFVNY